MSRSAIFSRIPVLRCPDLHLLFQWPETTWERSERRGMQNELVNSWIEDWIFILCLAVCLSIRCELFSESPRSPRLKRISDKVGNCDGAMLMQLSYHDLLIYTLYTPENGWFKYQFLFRMAYFQVFCWFQGMYCTYTCILYLCTHHQWDYCTPSTTHSGKWRQWKVSCLVTAYMIYQHLKVCFTWINRNTLHIPAKTGSTWPTCMVPSPSGRREELQKELREAQAKPPPKTQVQLLIETKMGMTSEEQGTRSYFQFIAGSLL